MHTITSAFDYIMCKRGFAAFKSKSSVIKTFCRRTAQAVAPLLAWMMLRERQQLAARGAVGSRSNVASRPSRYVIISGNNRQ
jgi:hypothetical protein